MVEYAWRMGANVWLVDHAILGIIFLVLMLLIVSRFFRGVGFCGRPPADRDGGIEELRKEIKALREEIKAWKIREEKEAMRERGDESPTDCLFPFGLRLCGRCCPGVQFQDRGRKDNRV